MKNRIREIRKAKRLSQVALAQMLGGTQTLVSRIEAGKQPMTDAMMKRLADALSVHPVELIDDPAWNRTPAGQINETLLRVISQAVLKAMRKYPHLPDDIAGAVTASLYRRYAPAAKGIQPKAVAAAAELLVEHELTKRA